MEYSEPLADKIIEEYREIHGKNQAPKSLVDMGFISDYITSSHSLDHCNVSERVTRKNLTVYLAGCSAFVGPIKLSEKQEKILEECVEGDESFIGVGVPIEPKKLNWWNNLTDYFKI